MREAKRKRLESKGWKIGTAAEFLGLTPEEEVGTEVRLRLTEGRRDRRAH